MSAAQARKIRVNLTVVLFILGVAAVVFSLVGDWIRNDLTPGFGMVQMVSLLLGMTMITFAGFLAIQSRRRRNVPRSLQADIGIRMAATGLVFAYVAGFSDLLGIGTHVGPEFSRPFVGPLQLGGLILGVLSIGAGALLYYTSRGSRLSSSMEFLVNGDK
jgi:hypothetical protein